MTPFRRRSHSSGSNRGRPAARPLPVLTTGLMATGVFIFAFLPEALQGPAVCLSVEDLSALNLVLVTAARVFVHRDLAHLAIHLGLLGYFGVLLERRLGEGPVMAAVLLGSVLAALISLNLLLEQAAGEGLAGQLIRHPPIGFAGAVAGLMGLFVVEQVLALRSILPGIQSQRPFLKLSAVVGSALITLFLLRVCAARGVSALTPHGCIESWALGGALLGGLGVGMIAAMADGDEDAQGDLPERRKGPTGGAEIKDHPAAWMVWTTCGGRVAAGMQKQRR